MRVIRCPQCGEPLPWNAHYCAVCGHSVQPQDMSLLDDETLTVRKNALQWERRRQRPAILKIPAFFPAKDEQGQGIPPVSVGVTHQARSNGFSQIPTTPVLDNDRIAQRRIDGWLSEDADGYEQDRRATWQKTVTHKTPTIIITPPSTDRADTPVTPSPSSSELSPSIEPGSVRRTPAPPYRHASPAERMKQRLLIIPRLSTWATALIIIALLLGGVFGVFVSLGNDTPPQLSSHAMSLQVSPASIEPGGTITLKGAHFSPNTQVGLSRDSGIPLLDTNDQSRIRADASGSFQDTVIIDGNWSAGAHVIIAEDARLHKTARFTIDVVGQSLSQRPPHLILSKTSVDLGSGDLATNSTQTLMLLNGGGGVINWQASATRPWLLISPASGTLAGGQQMPVTLAGDRSNLRIGIYSASIMITWNTEHVSVSARMQVTPLEAKHEAVLQTTPALLSFTAVDGGANPSSQVVTISNPGMLPLNWGAAPATVDGSTWLSISPSSGKITKGNSQFLTVSVNSSALLPGVYYGSITFTSTGTDAVQNNPQTIFISVTIEPQCALQVSPWALTFTAVYLQPAPAAKDISVGMNQTCSAPLSWSVSASTSNGGSWLVVSATSGSTPADPTISVVVAALQPGTYNGQLLFSSTAGTQTLPVTLIMAKPTTPIMSASAATVSVNGIGGQPPPSPQTIVLTNTGGGTLAWSATATTSVGGAWLGVSPPSGNLGAQKPINLSVTAKVLPGMTPGVYNGSITLSGTDGAGHPAAGSPQTIAVTFTVLPPCTLQVPSVTSLTFSGEAGQSLAMQSFMVGVTGTCAGNVTITPNATTTSGGAWLSFSPASATLASGKTATFSVGVASTALAAGTYSGALSLAAAVGTSAITGSPQAVSVGLTLLAPPTLTVSPTTLTFSQATGSSTQTITIGNSGGEPLNWQAALASNAPSYVTITSPASGTLAAGATASVTIAVDTTSLTGGTTTSTTVTISATDPITKAAAAGSPSAATISISPPAPSMQINSTTLNVSTTVGTNPAPQALTIANGGGNGLSWTAGTPSATWLTVAPGTGSDNAGATSPLTLTINVTGLAAGTYSATVIITPSTGTAQTITVNLTVN